LSQPLRETKHNNQVFHRETTGNKQTSGNRSALLSGKQQITPRAKATTIKQNREKVVIDAIKVQQFEGSLDPISELLSKPPWSPDLLLSQGFPCHGISTKLLSN
jgi:hypothetical protein